MKLRTGKPIRHHMQEVYSGRAVSYARQGIRSAADEDDFLKVDLYGCVRPLRGFIKSKLAEHCFLRIEDNDGNIVDSASFGQTGGDERDVVEHGNFNCSFIGRITVKKWANIKQYFSGCGDYSVRKNNCCTCAVGALNQELLPVPPTFTSLNHGVGTTNTCALQ